MDNSVFTAGGAYQGYTLTQLRAMLATSTNPVKMGAEIARREAVLAGDMTKATAGERLHRVRG